MSYIISGVEVKVGQVWDSESGAFFKIVSLEGSDVVYEESFPIEVVKVEKVGDGIVQMNNTIFSRSIDGFQNAGGKRSNRDLRNCIYEPNSSINQSKEQNMQNTTTFITDLRNEEPEQNTKNETWGDLPDGTAVLDEFGDLFIVNKYDDAAAVSIDGKYVKLMQATLQGCTQVQIEIQIKKTIRKL